MRTDYPALELWSDLRSFISPCWAFSIAAWFVVALEYALAFFLPFERTRKYFVLPGIALHLCFYVMLPVFTYSITVILLYLAYFDADRIQRIIDELQGH